MPSKIYSAALIGLNCQKIEVEVDLTAGQLHCFSIVGLPDKTVEESKERISSAIRNSGGSPPHHCRKRVTVNLAPADIKKEGPTYDLPIAVAFLIASEQIKIENSDSLLFIGELSLEGKLRPAKGILPIALMAREKGIKSLFVPATNAKEAALVKEIEVFPVYSLVQLIEHFKGFRRIFPETSLDIREFNEQFKYSADMSDIKGQNHVKRAMEIAAAGGHNLLMSGPPGSGKTFLAKTIVTILPRMTTEEALETTKIFSVAGCLPSNQPLILKRPFRSPHHSASSVSLIGGGAHPKPGEITMAHRGVLFLDEFPEFHRDVLEALRQPLEDGEVTVSRASGTLSFPARFILVAAMNPCPCGKASDQKLECICSPGQIAKYNRKLSGPLLDRIDLHVEVPRMKYEKLTEEKETEETSDIIRQRVEKAREIQKKRFEGTTLKINSEMGVNQLKKFCKLDTASHELMRQAVNSMYLSARAFHRILKVARTIADLEGKENLEQKHLAEAMQYRSQKDELQ